MTDPTGQHPHWHVYLTPDDEEPFITRNVDAALDYAAVELRAQAHEHDVFAAKTDLNREASPDKIMAGRESWHLATMLTVFADSADNPGDRALDVAEVITRHTLVRVVPCTGRLQDNGEELDCLG